MFLLQHHAHSGFRGRLFDHGVMVKALQNDKEVRNPTGLECDCLQVDCLQESAQFDQTNAKLGKTHKVTSRRAPCSDLGVDDSGIKFPGRKFPED